MTTHQPPNETSARLVIVSIAPPKRCAAETPTSQTTMPIASVETVWPNPARAAAHAVSARDHPCCRASRVIRHPMIGNGGMQHADRDHGSDQQQARG